MKAARIRLQEMDMMRMPAGLLPLYSKNQKNIIPRELNISQALRMLNKSSNAVYNPTTGYNGSNLNYVVTRWFDGELLPVRVHQKENDS